MAKLNAIFRLVDGYTKTIKQVESSTTSATDKILKASKSTDGFNDKLNQTSVAGGNFIGKVKKISVALGGIVAIGKVLNKGFDRLVSIDTATAKLEALGHSAQTVELIMDNALKSVSGTAFKMEEAANTAASAVAAGIAPGKQLERYLSLTADAAAIAGTNMSEMGAIFNKVTTSGVIQAQELNQMSDRGIPIFQMLAKEMGVTAGEIKKLASQGAISSEIFLSSIESGFGGAAQSMGTASFQATLDNIGAAIGRIGAAFLEGAGDGQGFFDQIKPLMVRFLDFLRSIESKAVIVGQVFGQVFTFIYDIVSTVIGGITSFFIDNWNIIWPILAGLGIYLFATIIPSFIMAGYAALQSGIMAAAGWALVNAPMLAIIATIAAVIYGLQQMGATVEDIFSFIGGVIGGVVGFVLNLGILLWNAFADFANFLGNVFNNPLASTEILFKSWANTILGLILSVAKGLEALINKIPGVTVDITSGLTSLQGKMEADISQLKDESDWKEYVAKKDFVDLADYATKGSDIGKSAYGKLGDAIGGLTDTLTGGAGTDLNIPAIPVDTAGLGTVSKPATIKGTNANGSVEVSIEDEDLKYLRDIAERDYINKFSTATLAPNVQVTFGDVREEADVDKVAGRITKILEEEIAIVAEGAY